MSVYLINRFIRNNLQLGNLKVNFLLLKLNHKLRKMFLNPRRNRTRNILNSGEIDACILICLFLFICFTKYNQVSAELKRLEKKFETLQSKILLYSILDQINIFDEIIKSISYCIEPIHK